MNCPECHGSTRVVETRSAERGRALRRRRSCLECERRFTTFERIESPRLSVRKRSGERQPFDRRKLRSALLGAAHKRQVSGDQVEAIVDEAAGAVERAGGELAAADIGRLCLERLRELDWGAYLQFAGTLPEPIPDFAESGPPGSVRSGDDPAQSPRDAA